MTFKEKLKQEHPEKLDNECGGGCIGCPCEYGYENENENGCEVGSSSECEACWNREMPAPMTAEESWELAKLVCYYMRTMSCRELSDVFGINIASNSEILRELSPYEVKAKVDEWERKQIRVGDVVWNPNFGKAVVLQVRGSVSDLWTQDGEVRIGWKLIALTKADRHIDIQSVLEQIGKEE